MADEPKPKLSLPEASGAGGGRDRGHRGRGVATVLLLAILALEIVLLATRRQAGPASEAPDSSFNWRELALKASQRNLHRAASAAWRRHLETLAGREDRGKVLYELGRQLMHAGDYEEAVSCLWQADKLLGADHELTSPITDRVAECLERLGKHDEKDRELRERVGVGTEEGVAGKVAAEIGITKIPLHELDRRIAREIDLELRWLTALPPGREEEVRAQLLARYADPRQKLRKLYEIVGHELLYRRGRELEIDVDPELSEILAKSKAQLVANAVVASELRDKIKPTEGDLRTYFAANREKFQTPPRASARILPLEEGEDAVKLLAGIATEEDLAKAATAGGKDRSILADKIAPGDPFPTIGPLPALSQAIFGLKEPGPCKEPVEAGGTRFIFFVRAIEPPAAPEYEAVKARVLNEYVNEKQREHEQALIQELFAKYGAIVHDDVVLGKPQEKEKEKAPSEEGEKKG